MRVTVTAKIKINPTKEEMSLLKDTQIAYKKACNFVSGEVFETKNLSQAKLHKVTYEPFKDQF